MADHGLGRFGSGRGLLIMLAVPRRRLREEKGAGRGLDVTLARYESKKKKAIVSGEYNTMWVSILFLRLYAGARA